MRRASRHSGDADEVGWISMVDLLIVLTCIALIVIAFAIDSSRANRSALQIADQKLRNIQEENARLVQKIGDWTLTAQDWERKHRELAKAIPAEVQDSAAAIAKAVMAQKMAEEAAAAARASAENAAAQAETDRASAKTATADAENARRAQQQLQDRLDLVARENKRLGDEIKFHSRQVLEDGQIRKDLLGINGEIRNVVFVVDRSSSMNHGGRWRDAKATILNWVQNLPMSRAAVVLFGGNIQLIPPAADADGPLRPDTREIPAVTAELRRMMKTELDAVEPGGATPTFAALRRAMDYKNIDAIILFTDGRPDPSSAGADPRLEVEQLVSVWREAHPASHVHVVAIGDYFDRSMQEFLLGVARAGGGAFIGR